jgi:hypothetical protein
MMMVMMLVMMMMMMMMMMSDSRWMTSGRAGVTLGTNYQAKFLTRWHLGSLPYMVPNKKPLRA